MIAFFIIMYVIWVGFLNLIWQGEKDYYDPPLPWNWRLLLPWLVWYYDWLTDTRPKWRLQRRK